MTRENHGDIANAAAAQPDRYAVVGHPVEHSQSPFIHAQFAAQTGQHLVYERLLAPLDGFAATVRDFAAQGGKGLNVTVPFKLEAHALATRLSPRASAAGAVNTLCFAGGEIEGDNTDGVGLVRDIEVNLARPLRGRRVLLLGAGGAARGVLLPLLQSVPAEIFIANRTPDKARALAAHFGAQAQALGVRLAAGSWHDIAGGFDVVINGTASSLQGDLPPLPANVFRHDALAYDMMYGKQPTIFLRFAGAHGAALTADGLGMLVEQAAESFARWRGVRPRTAPVLQLLRERYAHQTDSGN
ncbi:MAG: shikimate dehydrogenase [Burkholderiales bacterium]|nr:shikimate dehydrogenase [Burkholderiales bacterium]